MSTRELPIIIEQTTRKVLFITSIKEAAQTSHILSYEWLIILKAMGSKATHMQLTSVLVVIALAKVGADAAAQALPGNEALL